MKALFEQYQDDNDEELCGFILEDGQIVPLENQCGDKPRGFEIDPEDTLRYIDQLAGIWHTHPGAAAVLSGEDKLCMEQWPDVVHYIIGNDGIRKYVVENGVVIDADYLPR